MSIMDENQENKEIKIYIAPWALPKEEIPLTIQYPQDTAVKKVVIEMDDGIEVVEFINIKDVSIDSNTFEMCQFKPALEGIQFFGFLLRSKEIPKNILKKGFNIKLIFHKKDNSIFTTNVQARIFRPILKVFKVPESIILTEKTVNNAKIGLDLQYKGFGEIKMEIKAFIEGSIVSHDLGLTTELLERLHDVIEEEENNKKKESEELVVKSTFVKEKTNDLIKLLEEDQKIPGLDSLLLENLRHWYSNLEDIKKKSDILYSQIEWILIELIDDLLKRKPDDNITLQNPGTHIHTRVEIPIEIIEIQIAYRDFLDNVYEPIIIKIPVKDQRLNKYGQTTLNIPIRIKKIIQDPFYDVRRMKING